MAFSVDTTGTAIGTGSSVSVAVTPTTGASLLVVTLERYAGIATAPTFAGQALTLASSAFSNTLSFWYMLNPPTGAGTVSVPNTTGFTAIVGVAVFKAGSGKQATYYGGNVATAFDYTATYISAGSVPSNSVVLGLATANLLNTPLTGTALIASASYLLVPTASNVSFGWVISDGESYEQGSMSVVTFTEKDAGVPNSRMMMGVGI